MKVLIAKLGATGDVVRTTSLLRRLEDAAVTWITAEKNAVLLEGLRKNVRCFSWEQREAAADRDYDLVINLEDTPDVGEFLGSVSCSRRFGAYVDRDGEMRYTEDSRGWFDLSLISRFGRQAADQRKLVNRATYQELLFAGLGFNFNMEKYVLPMPIETGLVGDVAIAPEAGPVWPMKAWSYYGKLKQSLEKNGLKVNILPHRASLLEHLADVRGHRCLVCGDSLPMHIALGVGTRCVAIFNCTSPWEIYDYGILEKVVSPVLPEYFYRREFDARATEAVSLQTVLDATLAHMTQPDTRIGW